MFVVVVHVVVVGLCSTLRMLNNNIFDNIKGGEEIVDNYQNVDCL